MFEPALLRRAVIDAVIKLNPLHMLRNPVMFLVEAGAGITAGAFVIDPTLFVGLITAWLWATVWFANFAEALAEGRGKAQADSLRRSRQVEFPRYRGQGGLAPVPWSRLAESHAAADGLIWSTSYSTGVSIPRLEWRPGG